MNKIIVSYPNEKESLPCGEECELTGTCVCLLCGCCSNCTMKCLCAHAVYESNKKMEQILGLGDETYRLDTVDHFKTVHIPSNLEELLVYMRQRLRSKTRLLMFENF